jgi:VCBS repeat-containing protein
LDQIVLIGGTAIFTVVAGKSDSTLSYKWYKNNKELKGQTSSTLTLTNVSNLDQGEYYVDVKNSGGTVSSRKATLTVVNIPPVANNDSYTTLEDTPLTVPPAAGILTNDTDVSPQTLTAVLVSNVTHGTLSLSINGGFTYTPYTNYNGSDSFTYSAHDGLTTGNVATVTINITPVNDPPFVRNNSTNTLEDVSVTIKVLGNDSDPEGTLLTLTGTSTTNGTAVISGTNVVFRAATNFNGVVVFSYTVSDGTNSATANVTVTVAPVNDAPVSYNDTYTTLEDVPLIVPPAGGVLTNDVDVDRDS